MEADLAVVEVSRKQKRKEKKERKNNLTLYNSGNDIKYRGPIGVYQMRALAWIFMAVSQFSIISNLAFQYVGYGIDINSGPGIIISLIAELAIPCFLLGSFAYILQNRSRCINMLITYSLFAGAIAVLFILIVYHYGAGLASRFLGENIFNSAGIVSSLLAKFNIKLVNFNVFIDLLLCTAFMFFMITEPPRFFRNGREKLFRICALIPIIYEVVIYIFIALSKLEIIEFPAFLYAIMPTKAPVMFLAFVIIVLSEFRLKKKYFKQGGDRKGYEEFLNTRMHSFKFAKFTAKTFAIVGFIDSLLAVVLVVMALEYENVVAMNILDIFKIGNSIGLLIIAPFILLFSYNKTYKNPYLNMVIPIAGIGLIVLTYVEFIYRTILYLF